MLAVKVVEKPYAHLVRRCPVECMLYLNDCVCVVRCAMESNHKGKHQVIFSGEEADAVITFNLPGCEEFISTNGITYFCMNEEGHKGVHQFNKGDKHIVWSV